MVRGSCRMIRRIEAFEHSVSAADLFVLPARSATDLTSGWSFFPIQTASPVKRTALEVTVPNRTVFLQQFIDGLLVLWRNRQRTPSEEWEA
jgi:hypothetical protein